MRADAVRRSIPLLAELEYARSSGPGGQNVNKVETKVRARVDLDSIEGLSVAERQHARQQLATRLDADGRLYVAVDVERSRQQNEAGAIARLIDLVIKAARIPKHRIQTKPTRASRERRLASKHVRSSTKERRSAPRMDQ